MRIVISQLDEVNDGETGFCKQFNVSWTTSLMYRETVNKLSCDSVLIRSVPVCWSQTTQWPRWNAMPPKIVSQTSCQVSPCLEHTLMLFFMPACLYIINQSVDDYCRVILRTTGSDYINASFIDVRGHSRIC